MTVDGRQSSSIGMSWNGLATFLRKTVGATDALALDSGGSTTMWINGEGCGELSFRWRGKARGRRGYAGQRAGRLQSSRSRTTSPPPGALSIGMTSSRILCRFQSFSPSAPGGDGYVMTVKNPSGGVDSARVGDLCGHQLYRPGPDLLRVSRQPCGNGYERCGIFARDNGNQAFTSTTYKGNCYAMIYQTDTGQVQAAKVVNGVLTDFLALSPIYLQVFRLAHVCASAATVRTSFICLMATQFASRMTQPSGVAIVESAMTAITAATATSTARGLTTSTHLLQRIVFRLGWASALMPANPPA